MHRIARLCVFLLDIDDGGVVVQNSLESYLVVEVKEKQCSGPIISQILDVVQ